MRGEKFGRRDLLKKAATGASVGVIGSALGAKQAQAQEEMADKVPTRVLGKTGEKVPILLMGGSQRFDPTFDRLLHRAYKEGLWYIDTAEKYANGQSHVGVGTFIEQVGRENLWITSKSGLWGNADDCPPDRLRSVMDAEMAKLKTDYLDMYFMHGVRDPKQLDKPWIDMGDKMKKDGLTKYFGFSCHDGTVVELLNKAADIGSDAINAIMFRYNHTMYGDLELNKAMDRCYEKGIGLLAMKSQSSVPQDKEEVKNFVSRDFSLYQARLKAIWADERITACVSGITNTSILAENAKAAKSTTELAMRDFMQLRDYSVRTASYRCQGCNHICESRVDGDLRIADQLRYLMYDECYGDHEEARKLYGALRADQKAFERHDLTEATKACPQGIDIPKRLSQAKARLA